MKLKLFLCSVKLGGKADFMESQGMLMAAWIFTYNALICTKNRPPSYQVRLSGLYIMVIN